MVTQVEQYLLIVVNYTEFSENHQQDLCFHEGNPQIFAVSLLAMSKFEMNRGTPVMKIPNAMEDPRRLCQTTPNLSIQMAGVHLKHGCFVRVNDLTFIKTWIWQL